MILILIAIIAAVVLAGILFWYAESSYGSSGSIAIILGMLLSIGAGICSLGYAIVGWSWFASDYKAQIINREYGTTYTQREVFWASDVIDTVRELDRKRIELNGDLMREEADEK